MLDYHMAPTVLLEYTKEKQMKRTSQDHSFAMLGKSQKLSQGYCSESVTDHHEKMHESEDVGSAIRAVDSDDSSPPKRMKCMNLNVERSDGFNIPVQVYSLSKMSSAQRKQLETSLRSELEQVQMFHKRRYSRGTSTVGVNRNEKKGDVRSGTQMKKGTSGRFESSKPVSLPPVNMKQCETLLKQLMSHRFAWVFNKPVDVVKLNIPDYLTVIKHPMDFGTIKKKIATGAYTSPWGFVADVRLTFTNAMTYNPPTNDVHTMADKMRKFFEVRWKPIEKNLSVADAQARKETQAPGPELSSKVRKRSPCDRTEQAPKRMKPQMTKEDRQKLTHLLESLLADLPAHIIDFLRQQSGNTNQDCEEIEIDVESLSNDTLFELRNLLDNYVQERETQQPKTEQCKVEVAENVSTSWTQPCQGNDPADEYVDICGDGPPMCNFPTLEIQKDAQSRNINCSSSASSSSDSGSSSDSDSDIDSDSKNDCKENSGNRTGSDQEKSDIMNPFDINKPSSESNQSEKHADPKPSFAESDGCQDGKQYRAALLRSRFADTIIKAREKTLGQADKGDPEKLRREREEIERQQKEDRARLQADSKAVEKVRRRAEAEAAAEAKRKRELEREAARQALLKVERTVEINENSRILKDLEMLGTAASQDVSMPLDEKCPDYSLADMGGFKLGGSNPLEQLGLFIKADEDEDDDGKSSSAPGNDDTEEGEID